MSQENLKLVRSGYKAFAAGHIETVFSLLDPDITLSERGPTLDTPSTYHGRQSLLDMVERVNEGLAEVEYAPERFVDAGNRVLVEVRRKGRGSVERSAGREVAVPPLGDRRGSAGRVPHLWRPAGSPRSRWAAGVGGCPRRT